MRVSISKIMFAVTILAMASCDEWKVQMITEVMRDGSCVRTVASDDSSCLTEDKGWEVVDKNGLTGSSNGSIPTIPLRRHSGAGTRI